MRIDALDSESRQRRDGLNECERRVHRNAEAPEPAIDLDIDLCLADGRMRCRLGSCEVVNGGRAAALEQSRDRPREITAKHEDRLAKAGGTDRRRLLDIAGREGVDAFLGEAARAGDGAMPIAIGLYRGHDAHSPPHMVPDRPEIYRERLEVDLSP